MMDKFFLKDYEYKMHIKCKQDDDIVQHYVPYDADNVFDEC